MVIKDITELDNFFTSENSCIEYLEFLRWNSNPISPFDATSDIYECPNKQYKCRNSGKYFNVKTGTIFEDTKIPLLKWFKAIFLLKSKNSITAKVLANEIEVSIKTATLLINKINYCFSHAKFIESSKNNR